MDKIKCLARALCVFWPPTTMRIIIRGGQEVAAFRKWHKREPTKQEWSGIVDHVGNEAIRENHE